MEEILVSVYVCEIRKEILCFIRRNNKTYQQREKRQFLLIFIMIIFEQ